MQFFTYKEMENKDYFIYEVGMLETDGSLCISKVFAREAMFLKSFILDIGIP